MAAILDVAQGYLDYLLDQEAHDTSFGSSSTAHDVAAKYHSSIWGTFMVTGATSGMGREVAFVLASHGAVVILLSRNAARPRDLGLCMRAAFGAAGVLADRARPEPQLAGTSLRCRRSQLGR